MVLQVLEPRCLVVLYVDVLVKGSLVPTFVGGSPGSLDGFGTTAFARDDRVVVGDGYFRAVVLGFGSSAAVWGGIVVTFDGNVIRLVDPAGFFVVNYGDHLNETDVVSTFISSLPDSVDRRVAAPRNSVIMIGHIDTRATIVGNWSSSLRGITAVLTGKGEVVGLADPHVVRLVLDGDPLNELALVATLIGCCPSPLNSLHDWALPRVILITVGQVDLVGALVSD